MNKMMRALSPILCVLLALSLAGCSFRVSTTVLPNALTPPQEEAQPAPEAEEKPQTEISKRSLYGSVGLISEPTTFVSVYLSDASGRAWDEAGYAYTRTALELSLSWLQEQCENYGVQPQFTWADEEHPDLEINAQYDGLIAGGENWETEEFYAELDAFCAEIDTAELEETYGENIGFLYFLPVTGCDNTIVHYAGDGENYPHEYSLLYEYDVYQQPFSRDFPAAYAHEILHLFGACDLYDGSVDSCVTEDLIAFVAEKWPEDIMIYVYEDDGSTRYDGISQTISPVTAYFLGLKDTFEGIDAFPLAAETQPGVYLDGWQGSDDSAPRTLQDATGVFV